MNQSQRRAELMRHEGREVEIKRAYAKRCGGDRATLIRVNRTKAVIQFPDAPLIKVRRHGLITYEVLEPEQWNVPLDWFLLPGSLEPDPRQMEFSCTT